MSKKWISFAALSCVGALIALIFSLVHAAEVNRPLLVDGSFWFFNVLRFKTFFVDETFMRLFNQVVQLPAVLLLKYSSGDVTASSLRLLNYSYSLHPIVSILVTALILHLKNKLQYLVFPLLSLATATISTVAFSVGSAPDALTVLWPFFCLFLFRDKSSLLDLILFAFSAACLALTYESVILAFGLCIFISLLNLRLKLTVKEKILTAIVVLICLGAIAFLAYRIFGPTSGPKENFLNALLSGLSGFRLYCVGVIAIIGFATLGVLISGKRSLLFNFVQVAAVLAWLALTSWFLYRVLSSPGYTWVSIWDGYVSRTTAVPFALAIAGFMFLVDWFDGDKIRQPFIGKFLLVLAFLGAGTLGVAAFYDRIISNQSEAGSIYLKSVLASKDGCLKIYRNDYFSHLAGSGYSDWSLPFASIILQGKRDIDRIAFVEKEEKSFEKYPPCVLPLSDRLYNDFNFEIFVGKQEHFNYDPYLETLKRESN